MADFGRGLTMKNLKLSKKIELVDRGLGAEIFSAIVNGIGSLLALTALILVIVFAANKTGAGIVLCAVFYGVALFLTYLFSCLYHSLAYNDGKRVFRLLTITAVDYLFTASIMIFAFRFLRDKLPLFLGISIGVTVLSTLFNALDFEKFKYVRILGFLVQTILACAVAYLSLAFLPHIAFIFLLIAFLLYLTSFAFHIAGYQLSYLNSIGHILSATASAFLFFVILLYVI